MRIETHHINDSKIVELISDVFLITHHEDALDLLGNLYYQDCDKIVIHEKNIHPDFFDLKNGIAGEVLQKFSNYRLRLVIVGDFSNYSSNSLMAFMTESNRNKQVNFLNSLQEALIRLAND